MPTIITRGLGYDAPTVIVRRFGDQIVAQVTVTDTVFGVVAPDDSPIALVSEPIPIVGTVRLSDGIQGVVVVTQVIRGVLTEEGPYMSIEDNHIKMFKGDHRDLEVTLSWPDGDPVDLTDAEIRFTVKEKLKDPQSAAKITKANAAAGGSDDEIKIINAAGGRLDVYLVPADTEDIDPATYQWDIEVILSSGKKITAVRDRITLKDDVTTT